VIEKVVRDGPSADLTSGMMFFTRRQCRFVTVGRIGMKRYWKQGINREWNGCAASVSASGFYNKHATARGGAHGITKRDRTRGNGRDKAQAHHTIASKTSCVCPEPLRPCEMAVEGALGRDRSGSIG
jgi:hypothetical protein